MALAALIGGGDPRSERLVFKSLQAQGPGFRWGRGIRPAGRMPHAVYMNTLRSALQEMRGNDKALYF